MPEALGQWVQGFDRYFRENPYAENALKRLAGDETYRRTLLPWLYAASNPDQRTMRRFVAEWIPSRRRIERVARLLEKSARALQELESNPLTQALRFRRTEKMNSEVLVCAIESHANSLRALPVAHLARGMSFRNLWKLLPLVACAELVRRDTGKVSYADLAYLMEAAYAGHGLDKHVSPDSVRKQHRRFLGSKTGQCALPGLLDAVLPGTPRI